MSRNKPYDLHPEARMEIEGGDRWYSERSPDAANEFVFSVYDGIEAVRRAPDRWPRHLHGTRRHLLKKFPYSIIL